MFLSNDMKSRHYVNRSMNDDCVQYSITYHSSNDKLKMNTIKNETHRIYLLSTNDPWNDWKH